MASEIDTGLPPPLEDMTHLLQQLHPDSPLTSPPHSSSHHQKRVDNTVQPAASTRTDEPSERKPSVSTSKEKCSAARGGFGGLKKGFLFGSSPSSTHTTKHKSVSEEDKMPFVQKNNSQTNSLHLPELEQAMKPTHPLFDNKDFVTDSLLEKVSKNKVLSKHLADPTFSQAITEFQTNPQAALVKYQHNKEIQLVFKEFCALMGNHFSELGADGSQSQQQQQQPCDEDMQRMQQILANDQVREILMDSKIQTLLTLLKTDTQKAQRFVHEGGLDMKVKINKLIDVGLLQMEPF
ncbi:uncharacterized protein LOC124274135 [Haliotis rubra]|uniref:uncharacterized protein LOC124274135 n=1 Tax=Haliotis rubra TaxID=36100 RepID=UPI001EE5650F|nr:uncharacterized protein LOC124274135 [Haliotis rubra]XP_046565415.1 uncharacterized protein LOC124274135 [Haliotis rubra]